MALLFFGLGQQLRTDRSPESIRHLVFSGHQQVRTSAPSKDAGSSFILCLCVCCCIVHTSTSHLGLNVSLQVEVVVDFLGFFN